ncbi:MAG: M1 family metallopeptidase [bacterium]|nr:M1 family metallopeptidase [bacterium]
MMQFSRSGFRVSMAVVFVLVMLTGLLPGSGQEAKKAEPQEKETVETSTTPEVEIPEPETGPVVSYMIEAQLLPGTGKISASQTLSWRNTTEHTVDHLRFHLYYNGFRNSNSTIMRGAGYNRKPKKVLDALRFGEIKVKDIRRINGGDLTSSMRFVTPEDQEKNPDDRTVMELKPDAPVKPGETVRLKMDFEVTIPQILFRTGSEGEYFFIGQWFPKIGVLQDDGQWRCHQFHRTTEFFSDYGDYKVVLTIPERFVVGATGNLVKTEKNADRTVTYFYEEQNVHDFAWTAYPDFDKVTDTIQLPGNAKPTTVELLLAPGHQSFKHRYLDSVKAALSFYARWIYPYPYNKITVVDPPRNALRSGGMEYPTLITGGASGQMRDWYRRVESVTIHEFGHQYWYGLIGSDESREAWMDEGVNTFFTMEIMQDYFGNTPSQLDSPFLAVDVWEARRDSYLAVLPIDPVIQPGWKFLDFGQYSRNVYSKTAILLKSLSNLVGKDRMYQFFKFYAEKYKLKHPNSEDFIEAFNTFMNDDFSWAFDRYFRGPGQLDQAVHSVRSRKISSNPDTYQNEAVFIRKEGYFPSELLITLENGKEIKSFWKDRELWKKIVLEDTSPIRQVEIDPDYKILLDRNYLNNSMVRKPNRSGLKRMAMKIGFLFQNIVSFFAF